jgi:hypothetical protein
MNNEKIYTIALSEFGEHSTILRYPVYLKPIDVSVALAIAGPRAVHYI